MEYIIDGYNLCFSTDLDHCDEFDTAGSLADKIRPPAKRSLEQMRDILQNTIIQLTQQHRPANVKYHVVFDSQCGLNIQSFKAAPGLRISYSPQGLCADRYILEILHGTKANQLKTLCIVSNDMGLLAKALDVGAKTLLPSDFLDYIRRKGESKGGGREKKALNPSLFDGLKAFYVEKFEERKSKGQK